MMEPFEASIWEKVYYVPGVHHIMRSFFFDHVMDEIYEPKDNLAFWDQTPEARANIVGKIFSGNIKMIEKHGLSVYRAIREFENNGLQ